MPSTDNNGENKKIKKLLDMLEDREALGRLVSNISDTDDMSQVKRTWFNHVLVTIEKLTERMEAIQTESYKTKEELIKEINKSKDLLRGEIKASHIESKEELNKLEKRIEKIFSDLEERVKSIEGSKDLEKLKEDWNDKIDPIKTNLTIIRTKLAFWAFLWGSAGSGIILFLLRTVLGV